MSRSSIRVTLESSRTFAVVVAVVLAAVVGGVAAAEIGVGAADPADAGPAVDPPTYDPDPPTGDGVAVHISDGERTEYDSVAPAIEAAEPGDTVELEGVFEPDGPIVIDTPDLTIRAATSADSDVRHGALVDGGGEDTIIVVDAADVTVSGLWIANGGTNLEREDAGVHVAGNAEGATLSELYLTDVTFGVWVDGADDVTIRDSRIEGTAAPRFSDRGNGIHLWQVTGAEIRGNEITDTRDGIYYSWAEEVVAEGNTMWNLRFGVHYMYSNDNRLADNVAFDNDVGYALMVSERIEVVNNTAVANRGSSGHGILLKEIDHTTVRGNAFVANDRGVFLYNAQDNVLEDNLIYANGVGVHHSAGTEGTTVAGNSFVENDEQVLTTTRSVVAWNGTDRGNYWSDARVADSEGDGVSATRHRPAGAAERLVQTSPAAAVFADSPAFDAIRLVESRFPVVETAGIVDHRPLVNPAHDTEPYRPYAEAVDPTAPYDDDPGDEHHGHGSDDDGDRDGEHGEDDHDAHEDHDDHEDDQQTDTHEDHN